MLLPTSLYGLPRPLLPIPAPLSRASELDRPWPRWPSTVRTGVPRWTAACSKWPKVLRNGFAQTSPQIPNPKTNSDGLQPLLSHGPFCLGPTRAVSSSRIEADINKSHFVDKPWFCNTTSTQVLTGFGKLNKLCLGTIQGMTPATPLPQFLVAT